MAKPRGTKRPGSETPGALKGLQTELKRLGKAVSKQVRVSAESARQERW
jgi:hypothetical protein